MIGATQMLIMLVLSVGALAVEVWALVCAVRTPPNAYALEGKMRKGAWVGITAGAAVIGLGSLPTRSYAVPFGGILSIAALVAALVFLVSVWPKVREHRRRPPGPPARGGW